MKLLKLQNIQQFNEIKKNRNNTKILCKLIFNGELQKNTDLLKKKIIYFLQAKI